MKKIFLMAVALVLVSTIVHAENLKIVSYQSLIGYDGIDVHLKIRDDGTIVTYAGRSVPQIVTIVDVKDNRGTDGNLEITLSNGSKLIQTSGFSRDRIQRIYLVNGENRVEMKAVTNLIVEKEMIVTGEVSKKAIRDVIKNNQESINACYTKALTTEPNLEGEVVFEWVVVDSGKIVEAKVKNSTLNNSKVENCILQKLKTLKFSAPPADQEAVVTYPMYFN